MPFFIKFKEYSLKLDVSGNALIVADSIVLDARSVTLPKDSEVRYSEPTVKTRAFYAFYARLPTLTRPPAVDMVANDRRVYRGFEIRAVDLDVQQYLTVVTPGSFLYDYVIITPNKMGIYMNSKREGYLEETSKSKILYLV
ncbi:hypothetical protein [Ignicoccus hospitalis]|uniref:Uncharacterized protein n=1 Tax=Ignicoccus hospitalis (strain KIN4/I / DSM 18386 / JCM 14125) TaxID=453591 RepID=A8A8D5_IGNH4|nr:hypothetical protein [Ignicoccus hospitalis]ABU81187.1 hypothetical protein Igni_0003 [Ignicoccus hospitalis KIN4/I]HIH90617.1 hypothetical protein [Desulfurococcaceae archaeon]